MEVIIPLLMGLFLGWKFREYHAVRAINKMVKEQETASTIPVKELRLTAFKQDGVIYLHNEKTHQFLISVKTLDELTEFLKDKYPEHHVVMSKSEYALFGSD